MNKTLTILLIACLGMTASVSVSAEGVYKYVKDGKVVYGDQPPPKAKAEKIEAYSGKHPESQPTAGEPKPQDDGRAAIRAQECDKARARLVEYQNSPTLLQRNLKGEQLELSASERIDVIVRAQTDVNQLCDESGQEVTQEADDRPEGDGNFKAEVDVEE